MKNKNVYFGVSIVFLVIFNFLVFKIALKKELNLKSIPVVKDVIYPRSKISEADITYIEVPSVFINDSFFTEANEIIDKYTDIRSMLVKGSLFYKDLLFEEKELPDYPTILLNENQVAYTMQTDLIKLSGNSIVVGQKVDIYTTYNLKGQKPIVDLLFESVRVVGVKDKKGLDVFDKESNNIPHMVILAIDKAHLEILRGVDEIAKVELFANSKNQAENIEAKLNEEAKIFAYINNE